MVFGQVIAWGQYVVGLGVVLAVLAPIFDVNPIAGALIEVAFEGGHGTAGGMAETFAELGFPEGADLALGLATVGIVSGIVVGTALANWGRHRGLIQTFTPDPEDSAEFPTLTETADQQKQRRRSYLMRDLLVDPISLNFGFVGIAVVLGWLILEGLKLLEAITWGQTGFAVVTYVPLFPMALVGGLMLQVVLERLELETLIIEPLMKNIAGLALDVVVVTALASISLKGLSSNWVAFVILSVVGILWNVFVFLVLAPRLIPNRWFERGLGDFGQSMGVTATGILLIRMVDPKNQSGAFESFAYKQLLFEPIVGGGLFTAAAPALIVQWGPWSVLTLTAGLLLFWLVVGGVVSQSVIRVPSR